MFRNGAWVIARCVERGYKSNEARDGTQANNADDFGTSYSNLLDHGSPLPLAKWGMRQRETIQAGRLPSTLI
jgi:hypothetical protein